MIVIIDIDNTLSLSNKRFELAKKPNGKTDWNIAHNTELVEQDEPNFPMIDLAHRYKRDGLKVIILTGRPDTIKEVTELWLMKYHIPYDALYMRTKKDHFLKADVFKKKIYDEYINDTVFCAFDDDQRIIDMWLDLGIPCFKVYGIQ